MDCKKKSVSVSEESMGLWGSPLGLRNTLTAFEILTPYFSIFQPSFHRDPRDSQGCLPYSWQVSCPPAVLSVFLVIREPQDNQDHVTGVWGGQVAPGKGTVVHVLIIHYPPLRVPPNRQCNLTSTCSYAIKICSFFPSVSYKPQWGLE